MGFSDQRAFVFATSGAMARPAGVAGMMASDPQTMPSAVFNGQEVVMKSVRGQRHALAVQSPYAEIAPSGWTAREPFVQPNQKHPAAGATNEGGVDNTYQPRPLQNQWGKTRALAFAEVRVMPHKQVTDLLVTAKAKRVPPPSQTVEDMPTIRPTYSKTIPFLHPVDPQRMDSGFVREPNNIPGAKPAPRFHKLSGYPAPGDDWRLKKLKYDQTAGNPRIEVSRVMLNNPRRRPGSAPPIFQSRPAGLPGGLSLVATD